MHKKNKNAVANILHQYLHELEKNTISGKSNSMRMFVRACNDVNYGGAPMSACRPGVNCPPERAFDPVDGKYRDATWQKYQQEDKDNGGNSVRCIPSQLSAEFARINQLDNVLDIPPHPSIIQDSPAVQSIDRVTQEVAKLNNVQQKLKSFQRHVQTNGNKSCTDIKSQAECYMVENELRSTQSPHAGTNTTVPLFNSPTGRNQKCYWRNDYETFNQLAPNTLTARCLPLKHKNDGEHVYKILNAEDDNDMYNSSGGDYKQARNFFYDPDLGFIRPKTVTTVISNNNTSGIEDDEYVGATARELRNPLISMSNKILPLKIRDVHTLSRNDSDILQLYSRYDGKKQTKLEMLVKHGKGVLDCRRGRIATYDDLDANAKYNCGDLASTAEGKQSCVDRVNIAKCNSRTQDLIHTLQSHLSGGENKSIQLHHTIKRHIQEQCSWAVHALQPNRTARLWHNGVQTTIASKPGTNRLYALALAYLDDEAIHPNVVHHYN